MSQQVYQERALAASLKFRYPSAVTFGRLAYVVCIGLAVAFGIRWWVVEPIVIASPSMEPTLLTGVQLFNDKITLKLRDIRRGDIIVFAPPEGEPSHELVKRVVGLPGETVELRQKRVYIGGEPLREPYAQFKRKDEQLQGDNLGPITLSKRCLFVLGDNRDESRDSAVWSDPCLPVSKVKGLVRGAF